MSGLFWFFKINTDSKVKIIVGKSFHENQTFPTNI